MTQQMTPVWKGVANYNSLSARLLEASDMVALNRFICGLNSSEITQLNTSTFMYVHYIDTTHKCLPLYILSDTSCTYTYSTYIHACYQNFLLPVCHRDAVASVGGTKCSLEVTQQFKVLAVSTIGDPSTWTEAKVSDLGTIIG